MDQFLNIAGGAAIPKKPKTSTKQVDEGRTRKEAVLAASAETEEEVPQLKRKGWEERRALQKKQRVVEEETGKEVPVFIPQPSPVELDPELRQLEEGTKVRAPGKGKGPIPPLGPQSSLFEAKNITGARWFINNTFPEVDQSNAREEALRYGGASVVKHVLERKLGEWSSPGIEGEPEGSCSLAEAAGLVAEGEGGAQEMKLMTKAFKELKGNMRKLVHNGMKEHISNFISSSSFDSIVNLYRLPTAIISFINCRKKVKAEYPEVDVTKITFGEQEEGVEEDGESMLADFRSQIKLRWENDADGLAVFPPQFDFESVAVEEEGAEVEEGEMEAGVEGIEVGEVQPALEVEIHPVPSDDEQPPLPVSSLLCQMSSSQLSHLLQLSKSQWS
ncbi:hypothetical protein SLEP1_g4802 [Rubroshorea leprosula]|uniref:Uncharacterized protein n=1 Tax=Rubroshorea leprosula TaxID=152421 RepID=A0AAV5HQA6_9ROSI|nr:hypothetical protein SLEP1_g4802 [Rubroshorea leprosula]